MLPSSMSVAVGHIVQILWQGKLGQELKAGAVAEATEEQSLWLAPWGLLLWFSYTAQARLA